MLFPFEHFSDSEVGQHRLARLGDKDIGRFNIPVEDPMLMRIRQSAGNGQQVTQSIFPRDGFSQQFLQVTPRQIFHHQKWSALVFPVIVDLDDIRMCQARQRFRFPLEPLQNLIQRLGMEGVPANNLDRHVPLKPGIERLVNRRHPPFAKLLQ